MRSVPQAAVMATTAIAALDRRRTRTDRLIRPDHNRIDVIGIRPRRCPVLIAAAALATAGCGGTAHVAKDRTFQVALTEYRVSPQSVSAPAGTLTIFVHNYGRLSHNLVISEDGHTEASTQPIAPGQTGELVASLTPGKYMMASTILSDQALGTYGTLTITS
jgi:plastocyanin